MDEGQDKPTVEEMRRSAAIGHAALVAMGLLGAIIFAVMHFQAGSPAETQRLIVFYDFFLLAQLLISGVIAQALVLITWWPPPSARWFQGLLGPQILVGFFGYSYGQEITRAGERQPVLYVVIATVPVALALVLWAFGRATGRDRRVESS